MTTQHTPTPRFSAMDRILFGDKSGSARNVWIADCRTVSNAAYIVECVNAHDSLVAELAAVKSKLDSQITRKYHLAVELDQCKSELAQEKRRSAILRAQNSELVAALDAAQNSELVAALQKCADEIYEFGNQDVDDPSPVYVRRIIDAGYAARAALQKVQS